MAKNYDITAICKAVDRSATSVWVDRRDKTCPLHGDGMRRLRQGRFLVASAEVLQAYKEWLASPVPAKGGAA